jgi:hypothetical protein
MTVDDSSPKFYMYASANTFVLPGPARQNGFFGRWFVIGGDATVLDDWNPVSEVLLRGASCIYRFVYIYMPLRHNDDQWSHLPATSASNEDTPIHLIVYVVRIQEADAGPSQVVNTTSVRLFAASTNCAFGRWSVLKGDGHISNIYSAVTTVTGLSLGINHFRWTVAYDYLHQYATETSVLRMPTADNIEVHSIQLTPTTDEYLSLLTTFKRTGENSAPLLSYVPSLKLTSIMIVPQMLRFKADKWIGTEYVSLRTILIPKVGKYVVCQLSSVISSLIILTTPKNQKRIIESGLPMIVSEQWTNVEDVSLHTIIKPEELQESVVHRQLSPVISSLITLITANTKNLKGFKSGNGTNSVFCVFCVFLVSPLLTLFYNSTS